MRREISSNFAVFSFLVVVQNSRGSSRILSRQFGLPEKLLPNYNLIFNNDEELSG